MFSGTSILNDYDPVYRVHFIKKSGHIKYGIEEISNDELIFTSLIHNNPGTIAKIIFERISETDLDYFKMP